MKTIYYATIEICKDYVNGYSCDTFLWSKPCKTKQEAKQFINRIGNGIKGLYSVNSASIEQE